MILPFFISKAINNLFFSKDIVSNIVMMAIIQMMIYYVVYNVIVNAKHVYTQGTRRLVHHVIKTVKNILYYKKLKLTPK